MAKPTASRALVRAGSIRGPLEKFFADRGTHLAAMIAYFALISFVPLTFLTLAMLGLAGRADEETFLVGELQKLFPGQEVTDIVRVVNAVQDNAAALGLVGGPFLLWSSLSLFSVLESAFNIVYGRPNRPFLRGKALAVVLLVVALAFLFVGLIVAALGVQVLRTYAGSVAGHPAVAYLGSVLVSSIAVFVFLVLVYHGLTNVRLGYREVLPGALLATALLQATFQVLPLYVGLTSELVGLRTLGGAAILLVWLYLMANVIVFGAEINWWRSRRRLGAPDEAPELA